LLLPRPRPWPQPPRPGCFPLVLHALASTLHDRERLNRFTVGRRTFQRNGVYLSFAAKKAMSDDAPLATVKREFAKGESFAQLQSALGGDIVEAKSDKPSHI